MRGKTELSALGNCCQRHNALAEQCESESFKSCSQGAIFTTYCCNTLGKLLSLNEPHLENGVSVETPAVFVMRIKLHDACDVFAKASCA